MIILIAVGGVVGLLQLDITHNYLLDRIESRIGQEYDAKLNVGDLHGFLPFNVQLEDVVLVSRDAAETDTLARIGSVSNKIDIWELLQNKVSITGLVIENPELWLRRDENGKIVFLRRLQSPPDTSAESDEPWLSNVEILAPRMAISNGTLHLQNFTDKSQAVNLPQSVTISNLNANFFLEWTGNQRYLDIESISAETEALDLQQFSMTGQVYSDQRYLEFNSFYLHFGNSEMILNGEIDGVDLGTPDFMNQFLTAHYDLDIISTALYPQEVRDVIPAVPDVSGPLTFQLYTEGSTDSLWVDEVSIGKGESLLRLNGAFRNLRERDAFSYRLSIDSVNVRRQDLRALLDTVRAPKYEALEGLTMRGEADGSLDSINVDLEVSSPFGLLDLQGQGQLTAPHGYQGLIRARDMDVSWLATALDTTSLNFEATLNGRGYEPEQAVSDVEVLFEQSLVNQLTVDRFRLTSALDHGRWNHQYEYQKGSQRITGTGEIDFSREREPIILKGRAENINLAEISGDTLIAPTQLNFDYNVEAEELDLADTEGRASFDVAPSVIGGDSVKAHQFYADINTLDNQRRSFRVTSTLFDMNIRGNIYPDEILRQGRFWSAYLKERYHEEITIDSSYSTLQQLPYPSQNIVLDGRVRAKDLSLVRKYLPYAPPFHTDSRITFNVNSDRNRLLFSAEVRADTLQFDQWSIKDGQTQLTASFRSGQPLKVSSSIDFKADVGTLNSSLIDMDSVGVDFAMKQDSLYYRQRVNRIGKDARFDLELAGGLTDSSLVAAIETFYLGNDQYAWTSRERPVVHFLEQKRAVFTDFSFENEDEYFQLQGTLSGSQQDSLSYTLRDINLSRISDLVNGKVGFGGILNGRLKTQSLVDQPTIQGELDVDRFSLNDRIVGDVTFDSNYNQASDRFDTRIEVFTDPEKYGAYLKANDGVQQHFVLDGYFSTAEAAAREDSLFYFDTDFKQIDMWLIPLIVDNLFQQMEGQASGKGYVSGDLNNLDFHADFEAQNVFVKPRFVNTNYFINGPVTVDRQDGVILDSLSVMDTKGGSGTLWGTVDLNDFKPITYLDLSMAMDELQFLNNTMDPDIPFFGNVSGTGTIRLSGSNTDMYMRTPSPVRLTDDSGVSIPLLEETELTETGKFIQFVDSFEEREKSPEPANGEEEEQQEEALQQEIQSMTFSERFDLDLRFITDNNIAVNLIFDPVTGEELNARGSGQMRITMQDQEVQMFGRYQIASGTYQFVTGEIISRKLDLQPGGTIVWEGPPDNARLDISAVYHARPNIATLTAEGPIESQGQSSSQQAPVDLIVDITGTLNSVENSYYFQLPSSLDLSSSSTLSYTISQINRDEQQKLLQATSILFTGQFIPTQGAGSATASLSQSLTRGSTVLNPLLSNQVISPLLSNQINALLDSDVSRMDIDFNLNAYNEVDLGIALRLYNDRLILRREGQITGGGPQTTLGDRIGDLNATYRISRRLSLTAFHRQNQILSNFGVQSQAGDITPSVDGVGLETQFQFNTWQELWHKVVGGPSSTPARKEEENIGESATRTEETE
ncbi:translocation/assembly module TamB domain-containing protein [Fodinibius sediminis]|uniref:translocation/assembly module TamB domain-containing protein n=1 Tax=Fodinibius sediminis TaxID=1214077 RepID=UPI00115BD3AC|nr:translocation/assembly module TamB domain-containing protein [Fodinibius sediminis]